MTGLYLDISDYLRRKGLEEDYIMVPSKANEHPSIAKACEAIRKLNKRGKA